MYHLLRNTRDHYNHRKSELTPYSKILFAFEYALKHNIQEVRNICYQILTSRVGSGGDDGWTACETVADPGRDGNAGRGGSIGRSL